jgi:PDZ domain-containing secreted protein
LTGATDAATGTGRQRASASLRGLRVTGVDAAGTARGQLFVDDVIVAVMPSGDPIRTNADMQRILHGKKAGDVLSLRVSRAADAEGNQQTVVVNVLIGG